MNFVAGGYAYDRFFWIDWCVRSSSTLSPLRCLGVCVYGCLTKCLWCLNGVVHCCDFYAGQNSTDGIPKNTTKKRVL